MKSKSKPEHRRRIATVLIVVLTIAASSACSDNPANPVGSQIDEAERTWQSRRILHYSIEERNNCFCPFGGQFVELTVDRDSISRIVSLPDSSGLPAQDHAYFRTIDDIFRLLHSIDPDGVASMNLEFDPEYGYPKEVFVDPVPGAVDDEFGFSLRNLRIND